MAHFLIMAAIAVGLALLSLASQALSRFVRRRLHPVLATIVLIAAAVASFVAFLVIAAVLIGGPGPKAAAEALPSPPAIGGESGYDGPR